jgi:hypothetical protein
MIDPRNDRAGGCRSDDLKASQGLHPPPRRARRRCGTTFDPAMEMPRSWKSQTDFHKRLEIPLKSARFPHSHSRSSSCQIGKKTEHVNHASHTKTLTLPWTLGVRENPDRVSSNAPRPRQFQRTPTASVPRTPTASVPTHPDRVSSNAPRPRQFHAPRPRQFHAPRPRQFHAPRPRHFQRTPTASVPRTPQRQFHAPPA